MEAEKALLAIDDCATEAELGATFRLLRETVADDLVWLRGAGMLV